MLNNAEHCIQDGNEISINNSTCLPTYADDYFGFDYTYSVSLNKGTTEEGMRKKLYEDLNSLDSEYTSAVLNCNKESDIKELKCIYDLKRIRIMKAAVDSRIIDIAEGIRVIIPCDLRDLSVEFIVGAVVSNLKWRIDYTSKPILYLNRLKSEKFCYDVLEFKHYFSFFEPYYGELPKLYEALDMRYKQLNGSSVENPIALSSLILAVSRYLITAHTDYTSRMCKGVLSDIITDDWYYTTGLKYSKKYKKYCKKQGYQLY